MMDRKWTPGEWSVYQVERETYWPGIDAGRTSIVSGVTSKRTTAFKATHLMRQKPTPI